MDGKNDYTKPQEQYQKGNALPTIGMLPNQYPYSQERQLPVNSAPVFPVGLAPTPPRNQYISPMYVRYPPQSGQGSQPTQPPQPPQPSQPTSIPPQQPVQNPSSNTSPHPPANGKARIRVSKACDRCRTQKIKCLGTHPCTSCVKHKKECMYSTTFMQTMQQAESPHQIEININEQQMPAFKKQKVILGSVEPFGLPIISRLKEQGYITHLENRVQYLESLLAENSAQTFRPIRNNEPDVRDTDTLLVSPSDKWRFSRRHQSMLIVELCRLMYMNLLPALQQQVKLPRTQYFGWNMSGCKYLQLDNLPEVPQVGALDTAFYVDYFFREINPLYAILHESVFMEQVEVYNQQMGEEMRMSTTSKDSKVHQTRLFSALLFLVYALSIRFSEFAKPLGPSFELLGMEEVFFKYAHKVVLVLSFEWESFELTQAWLLIALYLRVVHRQTSSYHALGQAIFMAKSMGLGQTVPPLTTLTNYERLKAKRIYWSVYIMDRLLGLQTGRYCGLTENDGNREFPSLDFKEETRKDNWLTLEAFAMLHLARISNHVHTMSDDNPSVVKYQQINMEIHKMRVWLNENGFSNDDIYNKKAVSSDVSGKKTIANNLVKVQVKMHYYDLLMCVHGKLMFNFIGRRVASHGLRIEMVLEACHGVVELMDKCNKNNSLFTPWFLLLLNLFNVGVYAITMINGGVQVSLCRFILQKAIRLIAILKNAPVRNAQGKIIFKERFKMARECLWALKMANRILILKFEEDIKALTNIGIDHGSSDVNKQTFMQIGVKGEDGGNAFSKLLEEQRVRGEDDSQVSGARALEEPQSHETPAPDESGENEWTPLDNMLLNQSETLNNGDYDAVNSLLGNLQWFDQWVDVRNEF